VVKKLSRELLSIFSSPEMQEELAKRGIIANPGGPDDLMQLMKKETQEWKKIVDNSTITID
jgi:tripartite-type tricarboxylate transporter receptor subunit TctC